ncbi:GNAT family N-acetyltransferase, partial [Apilactobacillus sp. HBW1]|nr:GNAT family N-acetyltransferase [Apilactobacillus waqarii]
MRACLNYPTSPRHGKGKELLEYILKVIKENFPNTKVEIDAQAHAVGYYEKGGFKITSEPF